jgi:hypothetical protein
MLIVRGVIGGIILFLGRELNFLFAGGMAALIGFRLTPKLSTSLPAWADYAFIITLALLAAGIVLANERVGYFISGFLSGGYVLVEYFAPGVLTLPLLPFIIGGVIGSLIIGLLTEWALIIVSSLIGAIYATTMFRLNPTAETLVAGGLFVIGALTQVLIMRSQKQ